MIMENGIRVEHMSKTLGGFVLEDISFSVKQGYVLGLIGRNGGGKTTLLNTLMGLWTPEEGKILIGDYDRVTQEVKAKDQIAFITDECLFPSGMTPTGIGWLFRRVYTKFDEPHYRKLCKRFNLPMHMAIRKMSKGMVIKLQIALAFSRDALLYIFDEPSAGLDPVFRKEFVDIIFDLMQDGTKTIIFSTHITDELDRIADYILFLEKGKQVLFEQKEELVSRYRLLRGTEAEIEEYGQQIIGKRITDTCCEALVQVNTAIARNTEEAARTSGAISTSDAMGPKATGRLQLLTPTVEDIMYYFVKGREGKEC